MPWWTKFSDFHIPTSGSWLPFSEYFLRWTFYSSSPTTPLQELSSSRLLPGRYHCFRRFICFQSVGSSPLRCLSLNTILLPPIHLAFGFNACLSKVLHRDGLFRDTYFYLASYDKSLFQTVKSSALAVWNKLHVGFEPTTSALLVRRSTIGANVAKNIKDSHFWEVFLKSRWRIFFFIVVAPTYPN